MLPLAFSVPPTPDLYPGPPVQPIVQASWGVGLPSVARGYGVIHGFEPLMGYDRRDPTARTWLGHPDYQGEHWTDRGPVTPRCWSPNRIVFEVEPGERVHVNQNPGSWWVANGRRPFAGARCAEMGEPFVVAADADGRVELRIVPTSLRRGAILHGVGLLLAGGVAVHERWRTRLRTAGPGGSTVS